ncbi:MAG: AbrB/MazE/SpoVT family DNA-binding domain-containing protein [Sphingorhabdus sp.]
MADHLKEERQVFRVDGARAAAWPETGDRKQYRTRVFKSGNSLAVRIPAGTKLVPGMEMDLSVEDGVILSLKPIDAPKRKIDISKFAGKAPWLKELTPEERELEHRELDWHLLSDPSKKS